MTQDEIIKMAIQTRLVERIDECHRAIRPKWIEDHDITTYVEAFAKLVAEAERKKLQGQIETLGAMYELASKQRDVLMDEQRAQVTTWRTEHTINKAKNT